MKKSLILIVMLLASTLLSIGYANAASCTAGSMDMSMRKVNYTSAMRIITASWTADANGDVSGGANCQIPVDGYVYMVVTKPGGVAPTDLYDITLADSDGADVMEGALADRSSSNAEQASTYIGGVPMARFVKGSLSLSVSNAGNGGQGVLIIYIYVER